MAVTISLTLHDQSNHDASLSVVNKMFNNIASAVSNFCEANYDFDDWAYENLHCESLLLNEQQIVDPATFTKLTIEQWVNLSDELNNMGHDTTFENVKSFIIEYVGKCLEENAEYELF